MCRHKFSEPGSEKRGRSCIDHLGPSWGHLGAMLDHFGAILGPCWTILGPSWGHIWAVLCTGVPVYRLGGTRVPVYACTYVPVYLCTGLLVYWCLGVPLYRRAVQGCSRRVQSLFKLVQGCSRLVQGCSRLVHTGATGAPVYRCTALAVYWCNGDTGAYWCTSLP